MVNLDRRYLYLLQRHPDDSVTKVLAVRVFFARRKEKALHRMFSASRFTWTRDIEYSRWTGQSHMKIGIATNVSSRLMAINKDNRSGYSEWFALNWAEQLCVLCWMRWYQIRPWVNATATVILLFVFTALHYLETH